MTPKLLAILTPMLRRHEAVRTHPYDDKTGKAPMLATGGKITIGVGRNLTDRGLSPDEIAYLLQNDINIAEHDAITAVGSDCYYALSTNRQAVLVNMAFNLGLVRLQGFKNTLLAVKQGRYNDAAAGMRASLWAKQVGGRAHELADMMEYG